MPEREVEMTEATAASYDEVPYEGGAFRETHPDLLAMVAILHGLEPARVATARILEIGCASGRNLMAMADQLPGAELVGIDLSRGQIREGQARSRELGLGNLELHHLGVEDLGGQLGDFDYVIAHGLYSWVPAGVRDALLEACHDRLRPNGVAFVSYNVYPGWHSSLILRDMMLYQVAGVPRSVDRIARVREYFSALAEVLPNPEGLYDRMLKEKADQLETRQDWYLLHEYLEETNEPVLYHEFVTHAARHELRVLADARVMTWVEAQPEAIHEFLDREAGSDPVRREQNLDFLINRSFRRSILIRSEVEPSRSHPAELSRLRVRSACEVVGSEPDVHSLEALEFRPSGYAGRLSTNDPLAKAALVILQQIWPRSLPTEELLAQAGTWLSRSPDPEKAADCLVSVERLQSIVYACFLAGLVELQSEEPPFTIEPGIRPRAGEYARHQAGEGGCVTNLLHREASPGEFDRLVLRHLDGNRDRAALVERLAAAVEEQGGRLTQGDREVVDPEEMRGVIDSMLVGSLDRLGRAGFLLRPRTASGSADPPEAVG